MATTIESNEQWQQELRETMEFYAWFYGWKLGAVIDGAKNG